MLTQSELKKWLTYDEKTGYFYWNKTYNSIVSGRRTGYSPKNKYVKIKLKQQTYLAHRLAWLYVTGCFPDKQIDHENRIRSDNSWSNLRLATPTEQMANSVKRPSYKGTRKHGNRWQASIRINGKKVFLGSFSNEADAHLAYVNKSKELYPNHINL